MEKKNVLHLVEYLYLGGVERMLEQLAGATSETINIYFFSYETEVLSGIGKQIKDNGFPVFIFKKKKGRDWVLVKKLINFIKEYRIDIIHTHDFGPIEYAVLLKVRFPHLKLIHTQHSVGHFICRFNYTLFFQFASFFYYKMISVSAFVEETILSHCRFMKRKSLIIIHNGVDTNIFKKNVVGDVRGILNLVSISRISHEKNLGYLLNTCRLLSEAKIPFVFHHAGVAHDPEDKKKIYEFISKYQLGNNVVFHGFSSNVKEILDLGDIFLSASKIEGHPISVIEAMSSEKICFCSNIKAHQELGEDCIKLFDIHDEFSLRDLLKDHFANMTSQNYFKRSKLAREKVIKKFSLKMMSDNYVKQYI